MLGELAVVPDPPPVSYSGLQLVVPDIHEARAAPLLETAPIMIIM